MRKPPIKPVRTWSRKFGDAFRGLWYGIAGQSSFLVHFVVAAIVVICGLVLRVSPIEWCLLATAIVGVFAAELFNSALEWLAPAITEEYDDHIRTALDVASAAVLCASCGAAVVGLIVFTPHLLRLLP
ncbi:diacylglycerol kinase [Thermostilla marina]